MNDNLLKEFEPNINDIDRTDWLILDDNYIDFPKDYLFFMLRYNGGEGFVGENYLILWEFGNLYKYNIEYEVDIYAPDIFLFGSNGAGEAFGFNLKDNMSIVEIPFIGMDIKYANKITNTFTEFIQELYNEV